MYFWLITAALALEVAVGYPSWLYRRIGHPVSWIGALIAATEKRFNRESLSAVQARLAGVASLLIWLIVTAAITLPLDWLGHHSPIFFIGLVVLAATLPAQRSLYTHVAAVADALESKGLAAARDAVSQIVGRKTNVLDEAGVARAAIESLAENFSDGVVAPAFWIAV
ncbi:MAG TPA: CobD/CbiB family cobalamin biosynthesis protein, partial [Methylovirgula sp.]|nr:CobD/CbiB family cobalamin biosynthesis protein [Methylovirgula sp.]